MVIKTLVCSETSLGKPDMAFTAPYSKQHNLRCKTLWLPSLLQRTAVCRLFACDNYMIWQGENQIKNICKDKCIDQEKQQQNCFHLKCFPEANRIPNHIDRNDNHTETEFETKSVTCTDSNATTGHLSPRLPFFKHQIIGVVPRHCDQGDYDSNGQRTLRVTATQQHEQQG